MDYEAAENIKEYDAQIILLKMEINNFLKWYNEVYLPGEAADENN